uniref:uncharacterized protein LOC118144482 n=1 Tax=Callithrix jacchus TaxID=9483 RepID=UPI00159E5941|nr:uncharacterized protein LOC118144482 [Callithrix jacchus]
MEQPDIQLPLRETKQRGVVESKDCIDDLTSNNTNALPPNHFSFQHKRRGRRTQRPGPRTHPKGRAGRGATAHRSRGLAQPLARRRPRWEARRDGPAASLPLLLSRSYKYRLGPHPPPPTPGTLRAGASRRRAPAAKSAAAGRATRAQGYRRRAGDRDHARSVQPLKLEAWPLPAPVLSLAPLPPAPRADFSGRAACATGRACPGRARLCIAAAAGGERLRNLVGVGGQLTENPPSCREPVRVPLECPRRATNFRNKSQGPFPGAIVANISCPLERTRAAWKRHSPQAK